MGVRSQEEPVITERRHRDGPGTRSAVARPRGATPRRRRGPARRTPGPAPRRAAAPTARRIATSSASTAVGSPRATASSSGWSGTRVCDLHPGPRRARPAAPTSRAARTNSARVSSVAESRGASRCRSMSRKATAAARRTRCSTASVPTRTGSPGSGDSAPGRPRTGHLPHLGTEQRGQFLAQAADAGAQGLHAQPAAGRAHDRAGLVAARAAQQLLAPRLRHSRAAARAAGQLAAVAAGQQPRPPVRL